MFQLTPRLMRKHSSAMVLLLRIAFLLIPGASALQPPQCRHRNELSSYLSPLRAAKDPEHAFGGGINGDDALLHDNYDTTSKDTPELARIMKLKNWVDSFRPLPKAVVESTKDFYDVFYTYNSNAIEGNTLSMSETRRVLESDITVEGKTRSEHLEVIGHKAAIDYVESLSQKSAAITEVEIRSIHNLVCRGTMPEEAGKYRTTDVQESGTGYKYADSFLVPQLMMDFVDWVNRNENACHPVEFAAESHYRFVTIHPFRDGNGRVARLLMNLFLVRAGYPIAVITIDQRCSYIEALMAAQQQAHGAYIPVIIQISVLSKTVCQTDRRTFRRTTSGNFHQTVRRKLGLCKELSFDLFIDC